MNKPKRSMRSANFESFPAVRAHRMSNTARLRSSEEDPNFIQTHKPQRILILVTSLDRGGIETMVMNYYRKMDRKRWQFDFLVNRLEQGAYEEEILRLGGRIFRMGAIYPWRYLAYRREFLDFLKEHPEYQVIHSHLEERSYWPLRLAKKAGVEARICHAHNVYPFKATDAKAYFRQWFRFGLRRGGVVSSRLACSRHAGEWLYGEGADFTVVPNAIDFASFKFSNRGRTEVNRELGVPVGAKVAGFVGRLSAQKNPEFALRVFAGLPNREEWRMVFVGKGERERNLRDLARKLGVAKLVIFSGEVPDVAKYYWAFDVLLMPSLYEGLGMVAVEAGAAGLPVLASDCVPAEANVVKNTRFLRLCDIKVWQDMMLPVVGEGRLGVRMTKGVEAYEIGTAVKKLEKLYENLTH